MAKYDDVIDEAAGSTVSTGGFPTLEVVRALHGFRKKICARWALESSENSHKC